MNRHRLMSRLTTLEARQPSAIPANLIRTLAHECGIPEANLIAETEHLIRRCRDAGARTWATQLEFVAAERGISVAELEAEVAAIRRRCL